MRMTIPQLEVALDANDELVDLGIRTPNEGNDRRRVLLDELEARETPLLY